MKYSAPTPPAFTKCTLMLKTCCHPGLLVVCALQVVGCDRVESPTSSAPRSQPVGSQPAAKHQIRFADVTPESGIDFAITCGHVPATQIPEVNGGGLALLDFENDGDLDLFVANGATLEQPDRGPGCKLFRNDGGLKFTDITEQVGLDFHRWATGAAAGDIDADGFDDLFVSVYGRDVFLRNRGGLKLEVDESIIDPNENRWSASAAFSDLDRDGDLDLYVTNYLEFDPAKPPPPAQYKGVEVMAGPHGLKPQPDVLYENDGKGDFTDITAASGCGSVRPAFGLNLVIVDFDRDGRPDISVANDSMPGFLFRNLGVKNGHVQFEEIGAASGMSANIDGSNQAAMGLAIGDVDGNGFPDKFTTVFSSDTNSLHMNSDGRLFEDRSQQYGLGMVSRPFLGWSCGFFDFDHDGDEDLLMVNGHVYPQATRQSMDSEFAQTPLLFKREGKRFTRVQPEEAGPWLAEKHRDRNAVFADFDADGDIDIIVGELNGPIRVLRNESVKAGSWLIVELSDPRPGIGNHRGFGARIDLLIDGKVAQTRWLFTGGGFQSSGAPQLHFGLPAEVDPKRIELSVVWPDGVEQRQRDVKLNQGLRVQRASAP